MSDSQTTNERAQAAAIADRWLDEPFADPDGDMCVVARQFERSQEELKRLRSLLKRVAEWTPALPAEAGLIDEICAELKS